MKFSKEGILKRVKEVRERACGSQHGSRAALARLLNINYNTLKTYEEETVNLEFLQLLSEKTGTDLYWLLFGEERSKKPQQTVFLERKSVTFPARWSRA